MKESFILKKKREKKYERVFFKRGRKIIDRARMFISCTLPDQLLGKLHVAMMA